MKSALVLIGFRSLFRSIFAILLAIQIQTRPVLGTEVGGTVVELWPGGAPNAVGSEPEDRATLTIFLPPAEKATGAGVVICPGGAFRRLSMDMEGVQVARYFNSIGVAGCVLKYRLSPRYHHPAPLEDAQRGMRFLRFKAVDYGLASSRIGIIGFSAGGHVAATLGAYSDAGLPDSTDAIERQSCRPDFVVTAYPVIIGTLDKLWRLVGTNSTDQALAALSIEKQVSSNYPPTFLFHTDDDSDLPSNHSIAFYDALKKAGVPAELHVFGQGGHGGGFAAGRPANDVWPSLLSGWLRQRGLLTSKPRVSVTARVLIDGEPMGVGRITLISDDWACPMASAGTINGSTLVIPVNAGPCVGRHRIEVRHMGLGILSEPSMSDVVLYTRESPSSKGELVCDLHPGENLLTVNLQTK